MSAIVPVASWASVWSTRSAISAPGRSSPRTRCSSRIAWASEVIPRGHYSRPACFLYSEREPVGIAWFYLWIGLALVALAVLVFALWARQRRYQSGIVVVPLALLL